MSKTTHGGRRKNQTGRPPKPKTEKMTAHPISFAPGEWAALTEASHLTGKSISEIVRDCVKSHLVEVAATRH